MPLIICHTPNFLGSCLYFHLKVDLLVYYMEQVEMSMVTSLVILFIKDEQQACILLLYYCAYENACCNRMMKQAGGEFDVHALCHGLIQPWQLMAEQDELLKEAWIDQVCNHVDHFPQSNPCRIFF